MCGGQNKLVLPFLSLNLQRGQGFLNIFCLQTRLPSHPQLHLTFTLFHPYPSLRSFSVSFILFSPFCKDLVNNTTFIFILQQKIAFLAIFFRSSAYATMLEPVLGIYNNFNNELNPEKTKPKAVRYKKNCQSFLPDSEK